MRGAKKERGGRSIYKSVLCSLFLVRMVGRSVGWFRCQVGELTALLASELAAVEKVVSENVSRDRGFRALSEVSHIPSAPRIGIP